MQRLKKLNFRFIGWFFLLNSILFLILGSNYLKPIVHCTTIFQNLNFEYTSLMGKIVVISFIAATFFSYLVLLAFIPGSFAFFAAIFIRNKIFIWSVSFILGCISILLLIIDIQVFSMFKFHLNTTILGIIFNLDIRDVFDLSCSEVIIISVIVLLICALEGFLGWLVWRFLVFSEKYNYGKSIFLLWLATSLISYFTLMFSISVQNSNVLLQQTLNLPFYNSILSLVIPKENAKELLNRFSEGHFMHSQFSNDKLNYPQHPMRCLLKNTSEKPYNIIFIMVDSLRFDSLQHMPNTLRFAKESWQFTKHISGGNSTQAGLFSLFYAIPSSYLTAASEQHIAPVFIDLLLKNNYATAVFWSGEMRNPPMNKTIYLHLPNIPLDGESGESMSYRDVKITTKSINYLNEMQNNSRSFFLNIFYNAPHAYFRSKDFPIKYQPILKEHSRINLKNTSDPVPFYNSYLNAVDFIDLEIGKLLNFIKDKGYLENSIVIITSDHGQEFNENHKNYWEHSSNYSPYQVHVPLLIHWPHDKARKINTITSSYDLMPTLLSRLFNCQNDFADYSVGHDLLNTQIQIPFILSGSYVNNCIIEPDRLTTLHVSGEITMTDIFLNPIRDASPRDDILKKALFMMRKFYKEQSLQSP